MHQDLLYEPCFLYLFLMNYKIYNSLGTVVKTGFISNNINVESLTKGSYILELIDSTQNKRFWFIKN